MARAQYCPCGSGEYPKAQHDGYGIFMCYTCSKCEDEKLKQFRKDIFTRYGTDDQIEDDY
jgi:hypothetical protein